MATRTIEKIMLNWQAYQVGYDSKITIKKNWTKVDDFTLNQNEDKNIDISVPTSADYVDKTSAQTVNGVKTFWNEPVFPAKSSSADSSKTTAPATEAQVAQKQDALTLPSTPTSWHVVVRWANNKTFADWWAPITYSEVSKSDMDTGTGTTPWVVSAKSIADYVSSRVWTAINYKWQVADYSSLPASPTAWDMYNVLAAHTTAPTFDAGTNVVWSGSAWDPMAEMVDLSWMVDLTSAQTISWAKTFSTEPVLPSKSTSAWNNATKPATEAQVYSVAQNIPTVNNTTITFTQWGASIESITLNQASAETIALKWNLMKTATEYTNLPSSKTSDWNRYFIYTETA